MTEINPIDALKAQRTKILAPANRSHFVDPISLAASVFGLPLV